MFPYCHIVVLELIPLPFAAEVKMSVSTETQHIPLSQQGEPQMSVLLIVFTVVYSIATAHSQLVLVV